MDHNQGRKEEHVGESREDGDGDYISRFSSMVARLEKSSYRRTERQWLMIDKPKSRDDINERNVVNNEDEG